MPPIPPTGCCCSTTSSTCGRRGARTSRRSGRSWGGACRPCRRTSGRRYALENDGWIALAAGDPLAAHAAWRRNAEIALSAAPFARMLAAHAALRARRADLAIEELAAFDDLGLHGAAVEADRTRSGRDCRPRGPHPGGPLDLPDDDRGVAVAGSAVGRGADGDRDGGAARAPAARGAGGRTRRTGDPGAAGGAAVPRPARRGARRGPGCPATGLPGTSAAVPPRARVASTPAGHSWQTRRPPAGDDVRASAASSRPRNAVESSSDEDLSSPIRGSPDIGQRRSPSPWPSRVPSTPRRTATRHRQPCPKRHRVELERVVRSARRAPRALPGRTSATLSIHCPRARPWHPPPRGRPRQIPRIAG